MLKYLVSLLFLFFLFSCTPVDGKDKEFKKNTLQNLKGLKLGAKLTLDKVTDISDILKKPEIYLNKKVLVKGTVTSLCSRRGCWMEIIGKKGGRIRIKVRDGVIVFPMSARGKEAYVEGIVYALNLNKKKHHSCSEHTKKESNCEQKVAENVKTIYQIRGLGAVILD